MIAKMNFSLTQLEYVLAVNKHGHFAKAAEACHVTQPTLSMQIQKLEETLGITIFDRSKKPILLTDSGRMIIEQIQSVLFEARKIGGLLQMRDQETVRGSLIVGVIPTVAPYLLPRLLPVLEKDLAGVKLQIRELQTHQIIELLDTDEIDLGILAIPLQISKLHEMSLYFEPFSLFCRKDHQLAEHKRLRISQLKYDDIWLLEEGHCLRNQILDVCSLKKTDKLAKQERQFQFESGSLETLKNLVTTYGGYTLLPSLALDGLSRQTQAIPFERPIPAREIGLVYRREHYKLEMINALSESILKAIPEEIRKIKFKDLDVLPVN
jgi:LysR family hydrogen peroxide-inducible transcriptional activator